EVMNDYFRESWIDHLVLLLRIYVVNLSNLIKTRYLSTKTLVDDGCKGSPSPELMHIDDRDFSCEKECKIACCKSKIIQRYLVRGFLWLHSWIDLHVAFANNLTVLRSN
nr:hypothetical protein [Tanacetum cinerariifolium]